MRPYLPIDKFPLMKITLFLVLFIVSSFAQAADLKSLSELFKQNFNTFYQPRLCGKNIGLLITEAQKRKIDLSNSYVLKIEGAGFLETSGFYTRNLINDRAMLGYFHYVLVADGLVFDFDLAEPLILPLEDYVRLQFTPPYLPFHVFGINFVPINELKWWTVSRFELESYISYTPQKTWSKKMPQVIDLNLVMGRTRVR